MKINLKNAKYEMPNIILLSLMAMAVIGVYRWTLSVQVQSIQASQQADFSYDSLAKAVGSLEQTTTDLEKNRDNALSELIEVEKAYRSLEQYDGLQSLANRMCLKNNCTLDSFTQVSDTMLEEKENCRIHEIKSSITVKGSFSGIRQCISEIETAGAMLRIEKIRISPSNENRKLLICRITAAMRMIKEPESYSHE